MYSSFFRIYFATLLILILFCLFTIFYSYINNSNFENIYELDSTNFYWPLLNNHNITSYFGKRISPINGASSSHSGIDIAATEGTPIYNCISGKVIFTGFKGAGGYTLTIENNTYTISYCHISPNYLYKVGDFVNKENIIANVGPKNVYNVINNPYKDSRGLPTNGATTRMPLTLNNKKRRHSRQSSRLFLNFFFICRIIFFFIIPVYFKHL